MNTDLKYFYLNTKPKQYKYIMIHKKMTPDDIIDEYKLHKLFRNSSILVKIRETVYGLPHAGRLSYEDLLPHLHQRGYQLFKHTPGLFA